VKARLLIRKPLAYEPTPRRFRFLTYPIVNRFATYCPSWLACSRVRCWNVNGPARLVDPRDFALMALPATCPEPRCFSARLQPRRTSRACSDVSIVAPRYEQIREPRRQSARQDRHSLVIGTFTYVSYITWSGALRGEVATRPMVVSLGDVYELCDIVD
jgi:hypothetical protein